MIVAGSATIIEHIGISDPRWAGLVLVLLYLAFVAGSYLVRRGPAALPGS